jgi:hypothetical protein
LKKLPLNRKILIVGEGRETELNYIVGLKNYFHEELAAMSLSVNIKRGKGGNACNIVETAIKVKKEFERNHCKCDRVFLLMDTEGTGRAAELPAAEKLAKKNRIEIIYSSPSFEYWLLCHFKCIPRNYFQDCNAVIVELDKHWKSVSNANYDKADKDIFNRLANNLNEARKQALDIDLHHELTTNKSVGENPSSQVYELIGLLLGIKSGEKCPIAGSWRLRDEDNHVIDKKKGDKMPPHQNQPTHWRI